MTGDHLSFDGNCGVRQAETTADDGRSNGVTALPFLCVHFLCRAIHQQRDPRDFLAPAVPMDVLPGRGPECWPFPVMRPGHANDPG